MRTPRGRRFIGTMLLSAILALPGFQAAGQGTAPATPDHRDTISITGSSTVNPFTVAVARRFVEGERFKPPVIASTGTVRGFNLFCQGRGLRYPDIQNASRRMNSVEFNLCMAKGVQEIMELPIGYDGIVLAFRKGAGGMNLTRTQLWLAVAKDVPRGNAWVPNPYTRWRDIDASLPDWPIQVLGPPPTSGTRDSFTDLVLTAGCQTVPEVKALTETARRRAVCTTVRADGKWVDAGEDDEKIVGRITAAAPGAIQGAFGYSFLAGHADQLTAATIEGVTSTPEMIASGRYPVSRPLYIYVKQANFRIVPGLKEYVDLYAASLGAGGPLAKIGLVPLDAGKVAETREIVLHQAILLRAP